MFGQGLFDGDADLPVGVWVGAEGLVPVEVLGVGAGVAAEPLAPGLPVVDPVVGVAADAPATAAAAPPVAIAPATIVAPSILEMRIGEPPGVVCAAWSFMLRAVAKRSHTGA
jgi:hypothetical protein